MDERAAFVPVPVKQLIKIFPNLENRVNPSLS
jgi:hypothetical protein